MSSLDQIAKLKATSDLYYCNTERQMMKLLAADTEVTGEFKALGLRKESSQELIEEIEKVSKVAQKFLLRPECDMAVVVALFFLYRYHGSLLRSAFQRLDMAFSQAPWPRRFLKYLVNDLPVGDSNTVLFSNLPYALDLKHESPTATKERRASSSCTEISKTSQFMIDAEVATGTEIVASPSQDAVHSQGIITQTMEESE